MNEDNPNVVTITLSSGIEITVKGVSSVSQSCQCIKNFYTKEEIDTLLSKKVDAE